jgi:hypothetical protein
MICYVITYDILPGRRYLPSVCHPGYPAGTRMFEKEDIFLDYLF